MSDEWGFFEQRQACERLVKSRGGIIWWKPGAGKTRPAIKWFDEMRVIYKNEFPCVCVVTLKRTAFVDFRKELAKLDYDCVILENDLDDIPQATQIAMLQKPTMLLVSAGSVAKSVPTLLVDRRVKYAIIDELYMYKNPKTIRSKAVYKLTLNKRAIGLSGSIMTKNNIEDVYGQLMAVNKHRYVAATLTEFRDKFLHMKMKETRSGAKYPWRFPKQGAYRSIMSLCGECTHVYTPPKGNRKVQMQILSVPATLPQIRAFADLKKWMEVETSDGRILEYKNKLEAAIRIQQISNGRIEHDGTLVDRVETNKLDVLADKLEEIIEAGERAIVWCAFRQDVHDVRAFLEKRKIATLQFMSGEPFSREAWENGDIKITVATEGMGVSVNHFEQVPYAFYFSQNYNWMDLQQSMARTDRFASRHSTAFYYFLQVEGSLDSYIYHNVNSARDWENRLIDIGESLTRWQSTK